MAEREIPHNKGLEQLPSLNADGSTFLRESALAKAADMKVSGFFVAFNKIGLQMTSGVVGETVKPLNMRVALHKIKTVLNMGRSTSEQRKRMEERGQTLDDFPGEIGSLLSGGVALFADEDKKIFVGAIAFSGGTQEEDEEICRTAAEELGLFTDLPEREQESDVKLR